MELRALEQDADSVTAHFADGSSATAELLVGADGFRSTVRGMVAPAVQPIYCGYVGWRGLVEESAFSADFAPVFAQFTFLFPGHGEFIGYPIPGLNDSAEPGRRRYNFLWYYPVDAGAPLDDLLTDATGTRHAFSIPPGLLRPDHVAAVKADAAARLPEPYAEAVRRAEGFLVQPIYDLESPAMGFGRVALLGDAAFTGRPHVGVGVLKAARGCRGPGRGAGCRPRCRPRWPPTARAGCRRRAPPSRSAGISAPSSNGGCRGRRPTRRWG